MHTAGWVGSALLLQRKCTPPAPGSTDHGIALAAAAIDFGVGSPFRPFVATLVPARASNMAMPPMELLSTLEAPYLSSTA